MKARYFIAALRQRDAGIDWLENNVACRWSGGHGYSKYTEQWTALIDLQDGEPNTYGHIAFTLTHL